MPDYFLIIKYASAYDENLRVIFAMTAQDHQQT